MKSFLILLIFILIAFKGISQQTDASFQSTVIANNKFAFDLYGLFSKERTNFILSPFSVSQAMAFVYQGAKGGTLRQMSHALGFNEKSDVVDSHFKHLKNIIEKHNNDDLLVGIYTSLWIRKTQPIRQDYKRYIKNNIGDSIKMVDFKDKDIKDLINEWVTKTTEEKIDNFQSLVALSDSAHMVVANAAFFAGEWNVPFNKIVKMPFIIDNKGRKQRGIEYFNQTYYYKYAETSTIKIIDIPFKGDSTSLLMIIPKDFDKFNEIEKSLNYENYDFWVSSMQSEQVEVYIPKFTFKTDLDLTYVLMNKGMPVAFNSGANFLGMSTRLMNLSSVFHKSGILISQSSNVIITSTTEEEEKNDKNSDHLVFKADRPFIFIIKENSTGSILFVGHVLNPDPEKNKVRNKK